MNKYNDLDYIDLHIHTTCSDGTLSPESIVEYAAQRGIKVMSITDHDNVSGIDIAKSEAEKHNISLIPGIECTTTFETKEKGRRHILGYNIDYDSNVIKDYVETCQNDRVNKIKKILSKLKDLDINISFEDVKKFSPYGSIGKPHVAQALLEKGYVNSIKEAFDLYLGKGKPAYASGRKVSAKEVIDVILEAGGIPILAHPFQMNFMSQEELFEEIKRLMELGIKGIEVIYPEHSKEQIESLVKFAKDNDLYVTCGSDFHGENKINKLGECICNKCFVEVNKLKNEGKNFI